MQGLCIRFYSREGARVGSELLHDWLFGQAMAVGITGGTAYRAHAGYGRNGLQEDSFFELAGSLPEVVEFVADEASVEMLLRRVDDAGQQLIYVIQPVRFGVTGG